VKERKRRASVEGNNGERDREKEIEE